MEKRKLLHTLTHWIFSRNAMPRGLVLAADCVVVFCAVLFIHALRLDFQGLIVNLGAFLLSTVICVAVYAISFIIFRTYKGVLRFSSMTDLLRVASATATATLAIFLISFVTIHTPKPFYPMRWEELLGTFVIATAFMWALRVAVKYVYEHTTAVDSRQRVFIFGIRAGGKAIAEGLDENLEVVAFVTDTFTDTNHELLGKPVYLADKHLGELMLRKHASILMVSPFMSKYIDVDSDITKSLLGAGIKIRILSNNDWDGKSNIRQSMLREVEIDDLLPRNEIVMDMDQIRGRLRGKRVLITGAAGSIGSEIVRQVAAADPAEMVLIDQAETPLHDIRLLMQRRFPNVPCLTLTASICNRTHMEHVFAGHRPELVFHAAAYKHVLMMEDNPGEAIYNNVDGTRIVADCAVRYGVEKFVMISTDKAVNPTNVMGCSKRICEMYVQSLGSKLKREGGKTQFVTTRFGNVLGSNGSVIPLFREQIKAGGPVTVTHPKIIRYFMLIPEACNLVLEAGIIGQGGEIFVFDMGKPVRIAELAQRMIDLSGANDIEIKYTGLRDGEKLYEELLSKEENTKPSSHPKLRLANVRELDYDTVNSAIDALVAAAHTYDDTEIVRLMKQLVPEYISNHSKYEELDS